MLYRIGLLIASTLFAAVLTAQDYKAPVEWEFNVEGGLDLRREYNDNVDNVLPPTGILRDGLRQNLPSPFIGLSAMRRIPGLRAFWGGRLEVHTAILEFDREGADYEVGHSTASAMLAYRAFPFDIQGDCDCPTWGNDPWLKKALFVEAALGVGYQRYAQVSPVERETAGWGGAFVARLGLSHRLSKAVDVYAAGGLHGILGNGSGFRGEVALRPTLGLTYRPEKR